MDIATIGGLFLGIFAIFISYTMEGGKIGAIIQLPAMLLVIFGTIGAATITTSLKNVLRLPVYLKVALFSKEYNSIEIIEKIVKMAEKARKEGVLALEAELKTLNNPFFKKAMQLVIDGTEVTVLRSILETEVVYISERHKKGAALFQKLGGFSPTLGILGTVLGLIKTLGSTEDAGKMAESIAGAFIATLWGVGMANLVYLPISDKLKHRHEEEQMLLELIMEGAISIQSGDNPRVIRTKLLSFITPSLRTEGAQAKK